MEVFRRFIFIFFLGCVCGQSTEPATDTRAEATTDLPGILDQELAGVAGRKDVGGGVKVVQAEINYPSTDYRLEGHVVLTVRAHQDTQCSRRCDLHPLCLSFNFYPADDRCELNSESDPDVALTAYKGSNYIRRGTYTIPGAALGVCADNPCENGGWCMNVTSQAGTKALCICRDGWTGLTCAETEGTFDWSNWDDWSDCSATCGNAWRARERRCLNLLTGKAHSALNCLGAEVDMEVCIVPQCPEWKPWSAWSECSTNHGCGEGEMVRSRECTNGGQAGVDRMCKGPTNQTQTCDSPPCDDPIKVQNYGEGIVRMYDRESSGFRILCADGWDKEDADVACRQLGFFRGAAEAYDSSDLNPSELYLLNNLECTGGERSLQECKHSPWKNFTCTSTMAAALKCIVDGVWGAWTEWGACSVTCAEGIERRTRQCDYPSPSNGGQDCEGEEEQTKSCTQPDCPVDGSRWREWSEWSVCSSTCNGGDRKRSRSCESGSCTGLTLQTERCNLISCHVAGKWTLWAYWSPCDVTCDGGVRRRDRACLDEVDDASCTGQDQEVEVCATAECQDSGWRPWEGWNLCSTSCGGGDKARSRAPLPCLDVSTCGDALDTQIVSCQPDPCPVDGDWLPWSEWTACNKTCDGGWRWRDRECIPPQHGGDGCTGKAQDLEACNTHNCPEDAYWDAWSDWSACNVSCGGGIQSRTRACVEAKHGGEECIGDAKETSTCNTDHCPENAYWKEWSDWAECNVTCGGGNKYRTRVCVPASFGGDDCSGDPKENMQCNTHYCPIDCVWHEWTEWEPCNVTCADGFKRRTRTQDVEQHEGVPCVGSLDEWEPCNPRPCPVDGSWEPWSEWSMCSEECGGGSMTRTRTCFKLHGGVDCDGSATETGACNENPCPVDGIWNDWADWTACSATCENGTRTRDRTCEGPFHGGESCPGEVREEEGCFLRHCPVNGVWEEWSEWAQCTEVCEGGVQHRSRICVGPLHGGIDCPGDAAETQSCNTHKCPENGYWEFWTAWGECSLSCESGRQSRTRECVPPKNGGADCDGQGEDSQVCNTHNCPVDGVWEEWSFWGACDVSCGGGMQQRSRTCLEPSYGGLDCIGDSSDQQNCNDNPCPIDGYWQEWGEWEACSVTCGGGLQGRTRPCEPPHYGGVDCQGQAAEEQDCATNPCPVDGYWQDWGEWQPCNVTCGGGNQLRIRHCEAPLYGGNECEGNPEDWRTCNTHHCPVDCVWYEWTEWEHCNVTCGWGHQRRLRVKDESQYGGAECEGTNDDWKECFPRHCPIDGEWLEWSGWAICTVTCGGGTRTRNRTCDQPKYDGKDCEDASEETEVCQTNPCPIPGDWMEWSAWSVCSVTCEGGKRSRTRECDMDSYGNLTIACIGEADDTGTCHDFPCFPRAHTCQEWVSQGLVDTSAVDVKPNQSIPEFRIRCEVDLDAKTGKGILEHNKKGRHEVHGFEGAGEFEAELTYLDYYGQPLSLHAVITYVDLSEHCSQYISWECSAAGIHHPIEPDIQTTYWTNRWNAIRGYWGGAPPGSNMCACGVNDTCAESGKLCNCDMNDNVWRRDDGYLTFKDDLPIHSFLAGDTGREADENQEGDESGFYIIGPIECLGTFGN